MEFDDNVADDVSAMGNIVNISGGGYRYRECLKNQAVSIGGNAVDGCCEFMAAGEEGTLDALLCAACNCHRNFHRKERARRSPPPPHTNPSSSSGGGGTGAGSKKRFRTKFSEEQKDKMVGFSESVGWRIQKKDEAAVELFCGQAGVSRQALKIWMHNNKHNLTKKP